MLQARLSAARRLFLDSLIGPAPLSGSWSTDCPLEVIGVGIDLFFVVDGVLVSSQTWQHGHDNLRDTHHQGFPRRRCLLVLFRGRGLRTPLRDWAPFQLG